MATHKEWQKAWMDKQRKNGLCIFCKAKRFGEASLCIKHFFKSIATTALNDNAQWEQLRDLFFAQNEKCYLSGRKLTAGKNLSIDHLFSVSSHPDMKNKIENLRWCDKNVNHAKNNLETKEFIELCAEIVNYQTKSADN